MTRIKISVLSPKGAVTFPWSMDGRIAATRYQKERGGKLAISVEFESRSKQHGHRLDFDYETGAEIVDYP